MRKRIACIMIILMIIMLVAREKAFSHMEDMLYNTTYTFEVQGMDNDMYKINYLTWSGYYWEDTSLMWRAIRYGFNKRDITYLPYISTDSDVAEGEIDSMKGGFWFYINPDTKQGGVIYTY